MFEDSEARIEGYSPLGEVPRHIQEVVLHIGLHKTGSTAIQSFIYHNELELQKLGCFIPSVGRITSDHASHHNLVFELKNDWRFETKKGTWSELLQELAKVSENRILLSSEDYSSLSKPFIDHLSNLMPHARKVVILYLRRHEELFSSAYAQMLRNGRVDEDFTTWVHKQLSKENYDYEKLIGLWESAGFEVRVRRYGKKFFYGNNLYLDFLLALEIDSKYFGSFCHVNHENIGLSADSIMILTKILSLARKNTKLSGDFKRSYAKESEAIILRCLETDLKWDFFTNDFAKIIYENYREIYETVGRKYFGEILFRFDDRDRQYFDPEHIPTEKVYELLVESLAQLTELRLKSSAIEESRWWRLRNWVLPQGSTREKLGKKLAQIRLNIKGVKAS